MHSSRPSSVSTAVMHRLARGAVFVSDGTQIFIEHMFYI